MGYWYEEPTIASRNEYIDVNIELGFFLTKRVILKSLLKLMVW